MVVFGGNAGGAVFGDTWILTDADGIYGTPNWTQMTPSGITARTNPAAIAYTGGMTIFGGSTTGGAFLNDTWALLYPSEFSSSTGITNLSPASATVGGAGFTLTVSGFGLVSGTQVYWNGAPLTTIHS